MALLPRVNKVSLDRDRDRDPSSTRHVYRCLTRISGSVSKIMETLNWRSSSRWLPTVPVDHCHKEHPDNSWCRSSAGMFNKFWNEFYIIEFISWWSCIIDQHLNSAIFFLTETEKRLTHAWNPSSRASRYSAVIARIWWWTPPFSPPEEPSPSCVVLHVSSSFGIE